MYKWEASTAVLHSSPSTSLLDNNNGLTSTTSYNFPPNVSHHRHIYASQHSNPFGFCDRCDFWQDRVKVLDAHVTYLVSLAALLVGLVLGSLTKAPTPAGLPLYSTTRGIPRPYRVVPAYYAYKGNTQPPKRSYREQAVAPVAPASSSTPYRPRTYRQVVAFAS